MNHFIRVSTVVVAVAGAGLICGVGLAQSQGAKSGQKQAARIERAKPRAADGDQAQDGPRGHRHHPRGKAMALGLLIENPPKVDANGDGTISEDERSAARDAAKTQILAKFDVNGNGEIDREERGAIREAAHAKMLERFDSNESGQIDPDERAAIREAVHAKMLDTFDADGNGAIDQNERPHRHGKPEGRPGLRGRVKERFDADNNGKLDESERAAAKNAMRQRMLDRFDANGNGVIDQNERPMRRGPGGRV